MTADISRVDHADLVDHADHVDQVAHLNVMQPPPSKDERTLRLLQRITMACISIAALLSSLLALYVVRDNLQHKDDTLAASAQVLQTLNVKNDRDACAGAYGRIITDAQGQYQFALGDLFRVVAQRALGRTVDEASITAAFTNLDTAGIEYQAALADRAAYEAAGRVLPCPIDPTESTKKEGA